MEDVIITAGQLLFKKALEVQRQTRHDVFVDYSGHINNVSLRVFEFGWVPDKMPDVSMEINKFESENFKEAMDYLDLLLNIELE